MSNVGYTPQVRIVSNGIDITQNVIGRLLYVNIHDEAGQKLDHAEFELNDENGMVAQPADGQAFDIYLGYKERESGLVYKGTWLYDECDIGANPAQTILAVLCAYDRDGPLKGFKVKSYHQATVSSMLDDIAQEAGLSPSCSPVVASVMFQHRDRTNQSAMGFMTTLGDDMGCIFKARQGKAIFAPYGSTKTTAGIPVTTVTVNRTDCIGSGLAWKYTRTGRANYAKTLAYYTDEDQGQDIEVDSPGTGSAGGNMGIVHHYPNAQEAKMGADGAHAAVLRTKETFEFTCEGEPLLASECYVTLVGFRSDIPDTWIVDSCDQTFVYNKGYTTHCVCVLPGAYEANWGGETVTQDEPNIDQTAQPDSAAPNPDATPTPNP